MALPGISAAFIIAFLFGWNELLFAIILTGGSVAQTMSPSLQAISQNVVLLTAASTLSVMPPFLPALFFQKFITRLNVVDPTTLPLGAMVDSRKWRYDVPLSLQALRIIKPPLIDEEFEHLFPASRMRIVHISTPNMTALCKPMWG